MKARYVDAHCHVQFEQYARDGTEIIEQMRLAGVVGVVVGVDLASSKKALALAETHEHLFAAVGLHPNYVGQELFDTQAFQSLMRHPKVVAIGECGLDYYRPDDANEKVRRMQKEVLREHIALAGTLNKPLIIHSRPTKGTQDAYRDLIELLREVKATQPKLSGDVHFFVGSVQEAEALFALDFTVSFTAVITFAREYDAVVRTVPLSKVLSETDAPYVAPFSRRRGRNDPLAVVEVVQKIAHIRGEDHETVRATLLANALRIFNMPGIEGV